MSYISNDFETTEIPSKQSQSFSDLYHSLLEHLHGAGFMLLLLRFGAVKLIRAVHDVQRQNVQLLVLDGAHGARWSWLDQAHLNGAAVLHVVQIAMGMGAKVHARGDA